MEHLNNTRVEVELAYISIFINDLLHLTIRRPGLICIQSYKNGHKSFIIEYEYDKKTITSEYDRRDIWEAILKELGEYPIF